MTSADRKDPKDPKTISDEDREFAALLLKLRVGRKLEAKRNFLEATQSRHSGDKKHEQKL